MRVGFGGLFRGFPVVALMLATSGVATPQRFTDPDTLAPDFPTPQVVVERMLSLADTKPGEVVYDLGCGDGRIVITAAQQFKARAVGIEIRRDVYEKTLAHVAALGLSGQVQIVHGNALHYDLAPADIVTLYLLTSSNDRLRPELEKELKPTARVVSHDFEIRGWKPLKVEKLMVEGRPHMIYLYSAGKH
jgi:SAM-dependent methyltransferase